MPPHLFSLPVEILSQILSFLPVRSLLRFSATSRHAHTMANANLHTLSLGIAPWPSTYQALLLRKAVPRTSPSSPRTSPAYDSWIRIPNMTEYDYATLSRFQAALVTSVLTRHATLLQHIDVSIWSLSVAAAHALRRLHALKTLALRFESGAHARSVPRAHVAAERAEQRKAWAALARCPPVWSARLAALRLENAELETLHLGVLLAESADCRELVLDRCRWVREGFWAFVSVWRGRERVRVLELVECGGGIGEAAVRAIGGLTGLERLHLYDCQDEMAPGMLQRCNDDVWHIAEFVPPRAQAQGGDMVIEVDPEYVS